MDKKLCPICYRSAGEDPRAIYCCDEHRFRGWWTRSAQASAELLGLPLATLPPEAEHVLPEGADRFRVATQIVIVGRAPAGTVGYRVGARLRSAVCRWYPSLRSRQPALFHIDPFELPVVPRRGYYAVVYIGRSGEPIGLPRFLIPIEHVDLRIRVVDGDRSYRPRARASLRNRTSEKDREGGG